MWAINGSSSSFWLLLLCLFTSFLRSSHDPVLDGLEAEEEAMPEHWEDSKPNSGHTEDEGEEVGN